MFFLMDPSVARQAGDVLGLGKGSIPSYIVPVASFKLGDEEIHNTQLRVVDADLDLWKLLASGSMNDAIRRFFHETPDGREQNRRVEVKILTSRGLTQSTTSSASTM